ncbi:MAG: hypothetical protein HYV07_09225 [Deltaproteobacteria bacterium]|nr:hypothetical protein [Deltaproteobacteria bacterium]
MQALKFTVPLDASGRFVIEVPNGRQGEMAEVIVLMADGTSPASSTGADIFDVIAKLPAGTRTKADIDEQLAEERASWGQR